jgi:hypothetical protein
MDFIYLYKIEQIELAIALNRAGRGSRGERWWG